MQRLDNDDFEFLHSWIWDRTRALGKDLRTQRIENRADINRLLECLERSARFHLLSAHQMAKSNKADYSHQQVIEQLNAALKSLQERYKDNRRIGYPSACEPEFLAYRLILAPLYTTTQVENDLNSLPSDLKHNPRVQTAIEIFRTLKSIITNKGNSYVQAQANWKRFWDLIKSPSVSYLMACAAEICFQFVRHNVLDAVWRSYRRGNSKRQVLIKSWTVEKLKHVLCMDTDLQVIKICEDFNFTFIENDNGQKCLDLRTKGYDRNPLRPAATGRFQIFSQRVVEKKRYNRKFSAIIKAMSVEEAKRLGLMIEGGMQVDEDEEDSSSLFVAERPATRSNLFGQPNGITNGNASLSPAAPSFKPSGAPALDLNPDTNQFIKAQVPPAAPSSSSFSFGYGGLTGSTNPPAARFNSFNPFNATPANMNDSASAPKNISPFAPTPSSTFNAPSVSAADGNSKPSFSFATPPANAASQHPATSTPVATPSVFSFSGLPTNGFQPSFTPAGTPSQTAPVAQDVEKSRMDDMKRRILEEKRKADDGKRNAAEEQRKTVEEQRKTVEDQQRDAAEEQRLQVEAEAQRQRAREEEARQAKAAAERQRVEAERQRQRMQLEEQERLLRAARERKEQEESVHFQRIQKRDAAFDALTNNVMFNPVDGMLKQFLEITVTRTVKQVMIEEKEAKKQQLMEKQQKLADSMYERRQSGLQRLMMAAWIAKVEKRKKARKAHDRRVRLKEMKEQKAELERLGPFETSGALVVIGYANDGRAIMGPRPKDMLSYRKPEVPASARRTEEHRGPQTSQQNGFADYAARPSNPGPHTVMQTPYLMNSISSTDSLTGGDGSYDLARERLSVASSYARGSVSSSPGYSDAYRKSTAPIDRTPIDRTETDWFKLRAMGIDPSTHRKRSFGSASDTEQMQDEPKRPRISPSLADEQFQPHPTAPANGVQRTVKEEYARFQALKASFRNAALPVKPFLDDQSVNGSVSSNVTPDEFSSFNRVLEKARTFMSSTATPKASPSVGLHDFGRSVPNLGHSASVPQQSAFGGSTATVAPRDDRAAYWSRVSRFVPQHLYGQGAKAVRAYRQQNGLSSPASTRPASTEPLNLSSPIPTQRSYKPSNGYTQERNREEESSVDIIDVDAEDEVNPVDAQGEVIDLDAEDQIIDAHAAENGSIDMEAEEHSLITSEEEYESDGDEEEASGDSPMVNGDTVHYNEDHLNGESAADEESSVCSYSDADADSDSDDETHFASRSKPQTGPGATEDDAIELSD
jgi:hypothetical protein